MVVSAVDPAVDHAQKTKIKLREKVSFHPIPLDHPIIKLGLRHVPNTTD
jgi:hypothetical protein